MDGGVFFVGHSTLNLPSRHLQLTNRSASSYSSSHGDCSTLRLELGIAAANLGARELRLLCYEHANRWVYLGNDI